MAGAGIPNVNQAAAQGVYGAGLGSAAGMNYAPQQVQAGQGVGQRGCVAADRQCPLALRHP